MRQTPLGGGACASSISASENSSQPLCSYSPDPSSHRDTRGVQMPCTFCGKRFPKKSKRPQRFCCAACRVASSRQGAALLGVQVSSATPLRYGLKNAASSNACNGSKAHLHPSVIAAPVSVLGPRFPWQTRGRVEAKVLASIVYREIGGGKP
jgi:hypothetical protein